VTEEQARHLREGITDEIQAAKSEAKAEAVQERKRGAYFWAVMVMYMVVAPALAILVSRQISLSIAHRSEQKLCTVVSLANSAAEAAPPSSAYGKAQAAAMAKLRQDYGCP
jgi:Flp pilus assembly protein TadG